jgi:hypothetical protein
VANHTRRASSSTSRLPRPIILDILSSGAPHNPLECRASRRGVARDRNEAYLSIPFAILYDGAVLQSWQIDCLARLRAHAEPRAVLLAPAPARSPAPAPAPGHAARAALPDDLAGLPAYSVEEAGAGREAQLADLTARARDWAFILNFSAERCAAGLIDAPAYGVWEFRWGERRHDRGGPSGFWEVFDKAPLTVARLVRLTHDEAAIVALREGYFRTQPLSVSRNRAQLILRCTQWPAQVCVDIGNRVAARLTSPARADGPTRGTPSRLQRLQCRGRILARSVGTVLRSLFRHDQWNVGWVHRPIASFLTAPVGSAVEWLPPSPRAEFKADPFGVRRDGRLTILYEHFSYRSNRGIIVAIDPAPPDAPSAAPGIAVEVGPQPAVHLSYPYLLEADGRLLCIPESHQALEVGMYEVGRFPDRWAKVTDLLKGPAVVDATVFRHGGRWWLAGSEPTAQGTTCELNLWYAAELGGPWRAHAGNPVKMDVRSARPGGTPFLHEGALYRPAQDCSSTYGGQVVINRIETLTPTAFHEVPAATVPPDRAGPYPAGLHTLSQVGGITLIDSKRVIFSPAEFRRVLTHYLHSALKSLSRSR